MRKVHFITCILILTLGLTACGVELSQLMPGDNNNDGNNIDEPATVPLTEDASDQNDNSTSDMTLEDAQRAIRFVAIQHGVCAPDAPVWCDYEESMQTAASQLGVDLEIRATDSFSVDQMIELINQAVDEEVDGIAVTISDQERLQAPLQRANAAGIPIVAYAFGTGPETDGIPYITYFGQDNYLTGLDVANQLRVKSLGRLEQVVCVLSENFTYWEESRCAGVADALEPYGIETQTVFDQNEDLLMSLPSLDEYFEALDSFEGVAVATVNIVATQSYYELVEDLPQRDRVELTHVSFETNRAVQDSIESEETFFSIKPDNYAEGFSAIRALTFAARYGLESPLDQAPNRVVLANKDNLEELASQANRDPNRQLRIIAIQHALCVWDSFWCVVENGLLDAAADLSIDLDIRGIPEDAAGDMSVGVDLINQALSENPDGLIVTIPDRELYQEPLLQAIESGVPVIAINSGSGPELDEIPYLSLIAQDEYLAGVEAARILAQKSTSFDNRAVCLNHVTGVSSADTRCRGFEDQMNRAGIPVETLPISQDYLEAKATIVNYIANNPNTNIFLTLGPAGAHPFYDCLNENQTDTAQILHGTFDLSPQIRQNILSGLTKFSIDQQPYLQGYVSLESFHLLLRFGVEPTLDIYPTGPGFIDQDNIEAVGLLSGVYR